MNPTITAEAKETAERERAERLKAAIVRLVTLRRTLSQRATMPVAILDAIDDLATLLEVQP